MVATAPVAGGDIATATRLRLSDGTTALMKTLPHAPEDFFDRRGARPALAGRGRRRRRCPRCSASDHECLIIRWVEPGKHVRRRGGRLRAGAGRDPRGRRPGVRPGAATATSAGCRCRTGRADTWAEFYAVRRVLPYLKLARDRGIAAEEDAAAIEAVVGRLPELVPEEPPARLHGDLWNGNVSGAWTAIAWLIDPAAYGGHREVDLAMLALFGLPHLPRVLDAYAEVVAARRRLGGPAAAAPDLPAAGARLPLRRRVRRPRGRHATRFL